MTATFASWLIEQVTIKEQEDTDVLRAQVAALQSKLVHLLTLEGQPATRLDADE